MPVNQENKTPGPSSQPSSEADRQQNLNQAQRSSSLNNKANQAKNLGKAMTPMGALSLFSQIEITDVIFIIPISAALLKDISDILLIGSLPGLGTALSVCAAITIGLFSILLGASGARKKMKGFLSGSMKKLGTLTIGTIFEFVMGWNFLPWETVTAFTVYFLVLVERKQAAAEQSV